DHARRDKGRDQVHRKPRPAVADAAPDRREQVLVFLQAARGKLVAVRLLAYVVHHGVDRDPRNELAVRVDDRSGDEVVALEGARRVLRFFVGVEPGDRSFHDTGDRSRRIVYEQTIDGNHPFQLTGTVDDEELVRVIGHLVQAPQIPQHHFQGDVL